MHNNDNEVRVLNLPVGYFGMVLGTIGMGFAWRYASTIMPVSHSIGDALVVLAIMMWGLLTLAFLTRAVRFPYSVWQEMHHPIASSFVSLFPATTMLVAIGVTPWARPLALALFCLGVALQLGYAAWQTAGLWRGEHPADATTARWVLTMPGWCFLVLGLSRGLPSNPLSSSVYAAAGYFPYRCVPRSVFSWLRRW